jgi:hypothetical protein
MEKMGIKESIKRAVAEIESWPKWKRDMCGIESDYSMTKIDIKKIKKNLKGGGRK